mgnify:CR=1 FL=1
MHWGWLAGALLLAGTGASAQTVRAGIEAWGAGRHAEAVAIWRPLAARGNVDAAFNLGQAYKLGRGVPADLAEAQRFYEQAARKNHMEAQTNLGLLLFQNGNRTCAFHWLKLAAEAGEPRALLVYGTAMFNGDGVPEDRIRAYAFVSRAAAQGLTPAKMTLDEMNQLIPLEERQQGVRLAQELVAKGKPAIARPQPLPLLPPAVPSGSSWAPSETGRRRRRSSAA